MNKIDDATMSADAGPMRVPHPAARTRRRRDACVQRMRALRRAAAHGLLLLLLLADLVALPAWSMGVPFADSPSSGLQSADAPQVATPSTDTRRESAHCENARCASAVVSMPSQTGDESGDPSPLAANLIEAVAGEPAECEPCVLPASLRAHAPLCRDAALPESPSATRTRPHGPDPRPPLA